MRKRILKNGEEEVNKLVCKSLPAPNITFVRFHILSKEELFANSSVSGPTSRITWCSRRASVREALLGVSSVFRPKPITLRNMNFQHVRLRKIL